MKPPDRQPGPHADPDAPSERVLVLAPIGRDGALAVSLLAEGGMRAEICRDLAGLVAGLGEGTGLALVTQEALLSADLYPLAAWIAAQPAWSDLPFVVVTGRGGGPERNPDAARLLETLGNVTLVERPFHPFTLVSVARTALRSRRRQYQAQAQLAELARRQQAIEESEARFSFALEAGLLGAWELSFDSGRLRASDIFRAQFGKPQDEHFGYDDMLGALHENDAALARAALSFSIANNTNFAAEYKVFWPDGTVRWMELRGRPTRSASGQSRIAGVSIDITARKTIETELGHLVEARTADLTQALDRLQAEVSERQRTEEALRQSQKMESLGQLTGGIAHDFNNLLTGISGCLELMQTRLQQGRTGEIGRYITAAAESVTRAASLTHRLLAFARRQTLELKQVNVNRLASGMEDLIRRTVGPTIDVEMVFTGGVWMTLCDSNQLESALLNLCINAKDAMEGAGRLTIETANVRLDDAYAASQRDVRPGQYVMLSVTDTGVGMSAATVASAFDPFFTTKPIGQGTGLGLSMVYGFVKQSGGHVRIYSEPGIGTTIRLYLPRDLAMEDQPVAAVQAVAPADIVRSGKKVVVVEDEALIRGLIVDMLEEGGYQILEASDGPSGLRVIEQAEDVELLVTDVGLPGMNGRQLADAARALHPALKVLFITGYAHNAAVGNRLLEENMQLITKPFALDVLAAKIRGMVEAT